MLVLDILDREINIGDEVILSDGVGNYKALLIRETKLSVEYKVWVNNSNSYRDDWKFWIRKSSTNFRYMYKI